MICKFTIENVYDLAVMISSEHHKVLTLFYYTNDLNEKTFYGTVLAYNLYWDTQRFRWFLREKSQPYAIIPILGGEYYDL